MLNSLMLIFMSVRMSEWKPLTLLSLGAWVTQVAQYCVFFLCGFTELILCEGGDLCINRKKHHR